MCWPLVADGLVETHPWPGSHCQVQVQVQVLAMWSPWEEGRVMINSSTVLILDLVTRPSSGRLLVLELVGHKLSGIELQLSSHVTSFKVVRSKLKCQYYQ